MNKPHNKKSSFFFTLVLVASFYLVVSCSGGGNPPNTETDTHVELSVENSLDVVSSVCSAANDSRAMYTLLDASFTQLASDRIAFLNIIVQGEKDGDCGGRLEIAQADIGPPVTLSSNLVEFCQTTETGNVVLNGVTELVYTDSSQWSTATPQTDVSHTSGDQYLLDTTFSGTSAINDPVLTVTGTLTNHLNQQTYTFTEFEHNITSEISLNGTLHLNPLGTIEIATEIPFVRNENNELVDGTLTINGARQDFLQLRVTGPDTIILDLISDAGQTTPINEFTLEDFCF